MVVDDPVRELALSAIDADAQAHSLLASADGSMRLSFSTLYRFVMDPEFELSPQQAATLAANSHEQADLQRLIRNNAIAYMPKQAAASSGAIARRETETAIITLTPSRADADQVYLVVELTDPESTLPKQLFVGQVNGAWHRFVLPDFSAGRTQALLMAKGDLVQALGDPEAEVYLR